MEHVRTWLLRSADKPTTSTTRYRLLRYIVPLLVAATAIVTIASPAQAYVGYPYQRCATIGGGGTVDICVAWTGGWPGGLVRAETSPTAYYAERLMECSGCQGQSIWNWTVVATGTGYVGYSPSRTAGKYSYYKACTETFQNGPWACMYNQDAVWLGD